MDLVREPLRDDLLDQQWIFVNSGAFDLELLPFGFCRLTNAIGIGLREQGFALLLGAGVGDLIRRCCLREQFLALLFRLTIRNLCLGLRFGEEFLPLLFGFAVDHLRLSRGIRILQSRLFCGFGFEARLLDLFLLQREGVLH